MFCTHCGTENPDGSKFCTNCGKDPAGKTDSAILAPTNSTGSGHWFAGSGGVLALICFFIPWVLVSCGAQSVSLSGYGLAAGEQGTKPTSELFIVPIAAAIALVLVYNILKAGHSNAAVSLIFVVLGILPLWVLLQQIPKWQTVQAQAAYWGMQYTFQPGLWGTILGCALLLVGGMLGFKKKTT